MSTQGASTSSPSSSSSTPRRKYVVFLSFRGEDTRRTFADHLYDALHRKDILTFRDVLLEGGNFISTGILEAVEESRFAIVVFSRNYASSAWCLDELANIVRCMKEKGMRVLPVYYDIDPSEVQKQSGTFGIAFAEHEERFKENIEKVQIWRAALHVVANLPGWDARYRNVSELIKSIVEWILQYLSSSFSSITNDLVGIDSSLKELCTLYSNIGNNVLMIGICGMGGSGKTTLARAFYERFHGCFEGSSFIANAREYSEKLDLLQLQQQLLEDIFEERNKEIMSVYDGVGMIKGRLCHKKVLIVLDNVNKLDQLENLAGGHDWFGLGSLIIVTSRDEHLLVHHGVHKIYKPNLLCSDDALKLFCLKAFKNEKPKEDYMQLSLDVVRYASGLPLALVTFGSFLFGRTMDIRLSELDRFGKTPRREIFDTLKVSYDELEEMWKDIFLDVACFFRGKMKDQVIEILETCGFHARIGIRVLVDKSLLTIENNALQMHELVQEMGMEIVRQESHEEPGKRSRLWLRKDLFHVLTNNTATAAIQAIVLDLFGGDEAYRHIESYSEGFSRMCNLRLLIIYNVHISNGLKHLSYKLKLLDWRGYSSKCLPSRFQSKELVELRLRFSKIEYLWRGVKYFDKLKLINLEHSINLIRTPDFTGVTRLERLCLRGCISLVEIHPSIGLLSKLTVLNLECCQSLINLPSSMDSLRSLEILNLLGCSKLAKLPENLGKIKCLKELDFTGTAIREVPSSISFLICRGCENKIFKSRLDSVHHELDNSAVVKACKIMRTYDDSNKAERSASWSFPEETEQAMGKTKDEEEENKRGQFSWSKPMQCLLLEVLANGATKGNKPSNTLMPESLAQAAQAICKKFGVECQCNHVENCLRTMESIWSTITQLHNRKNIFGWNDNLKMITCEKNAYDEEVMAHPNHEQYLNKKIEMYDKMALLFCKDLATWSSALSFSDIDSEKKIVDLEANDPDIDSEKVSTGEQVISSNAALCGTSSHRRKSRAIQDANYDKFSKRLQRVELAIKELKKDQLDMKELYEEVMKIERFDEVMLASAFDYLVDNEREAKAFMATNARLRSSWLENFFNKNGGYGN